MVIKIGGQSNGKASHCTNQGEYLQIKIGGQSNGKASSHCTNQGEYLR